MYIANDRLIYNMNMQIMAPLRREMFTFLGLSQLVPRKSTGGLLLLQ